MKAIRFSEHGAANVLKLEDAPDPKPGYGEVLVAIKAAGINHLDIWVRQGMPGVDIPMPHIPGSDACGLVAACGEGVTHLKTGDRVLLAPGMSFEKDKQVLSGWDSLSSGYHLLGLQVNGTYAEAIVVPESRAIKVSNIYSYEEWASTPLVFLTAWHMLHTHVNLDCRDTVLIHAAGSGIGQAAIQIAKLKGAEVITTVGNEDKVKRAKDLGADHVINYQKSNFSDEVLKITQKKGVDVIFEHIGPDIWEQNFRCLAKGGRMVTCGATSGPKVQLDLRVLFMRQLTIKGSYMGSHGELLEVINLLEEKKLKPVVSDVFDLKDAAKAHRTMESRNIFGKLILRV